jgi:hypothetical protein
MPGVLAIITPDNAGKLSHPEKVQQAVAGPLLQNKDILFNGQHVAVVVAETLEQAQAAASGGPRHLFPWRGHDVDGCDAWAGLRAEAFSQRSAAAGFQTR